MNKLRINFHNNIWVIIMGKEEEYEKGDDATEYGEFIPSYHHWVGLEEQKRIAKKLEKITKHKK